MHRKGSAVRAVVATAATLLAGVAAGSPSLAAPPVPSPVAAEGSALARGLVTSESVVGTSSGGVVTVAVPRVAFGPSLSVSAGHLHAAVLLTDPDVTGSASVIGASRASGCAIRLVHGVMGSLDCTLPPGATGPQTIAVTLSDGWRLVVLVS
jgi:hypothetical protein